MVLKESFNRRANDNLTLFANFATLDGGYTELRPGAEGIADKDLKRTPDFSYRLGVIYDTILENGELNFTGVLNREDEYFNNQNNTPAGLRPAVSKIDLTFTYVPNDGNWRVMAGCTNCSDKRLSILHWILLHLALLHNSKICLDYGEYLTNITFK